MSLWTPAQIATAAWWDASDVSTISDTGGAVDQWNDKSGNDRHFTQTTPADQATTNSTTQNGLNVLDFDGDDQYSGTQPVVSEINYFLVRRTSDSATLDFSGSDTQKFSFVSESGSGGDIHLNFGAPSLYKNGTLESPDNRGQVFDLINTGSWDLIGFIDADVSTWGGALNIGYPYNDLYNSVANYAEIIVVEGTITTELRQRIEGYLTHKWGLEANLPVDHPYKSAAPTTNTGAVNQNGLVASVDYPNQRIYLDIGSANIRLDTLDVFREVRTLRATTEDHRRFPPIIFSGGNVQKTADTATAKFVKLTAGTMIVPYDGDHTITLTRDTFTEDNISGTDVFDLTLLSPSTSVQIKEDIPQVEVITVSTGSGLDTAQSQSLTNSEIILNKLDSLLEDSQGLRFTSKALELTPSSGGSSTTYSPIDQATIVVGSNSSGTVTDTQSRNSVPYVVQVASSGLEIELKVTSSDVSKTPYSVRVSATYTTGSNENHLNFQSYNYVKNTWESKGSIKGRSTSFMYVFDLDIDNQHSTTGELKFRLVHNMVPTYDESSYLSLDYFMVSKTINNPEMMSYLAQVLRIQQAGAKKKVLSFGEVISGGAQSLVISQDSKAGSLEYTEIEITSGIGIGQTRLILSYDKDSGHVDVDREWLEVPQPGSQYEIRAAGSSLLSGVPHAGTIKKLRSQIQTIQ